MKRKATIKEIKVWYRFRPELSIWLSTSSGKSYLCKLPDETWYDGYCFNAGLFSFIQFKYFALHIMLKWWIINI